MDIHADLSKPVDIIPDGWEWVDSPQRGVTRVMLDRVGDEVAVATSFVRYVPDSSFPGHDHALGEEFIVLEGEFGDEHGRYPAGSYVRNPPGSHHVPFSEPGCLIWVKLRQFQTDDQTQMVRTLDTAIPGTGSSSRQLHNYGTERVAEVVVAAGESLELPAQERPQEILILEGEVRLNDRLLPRWSWMRTPAGSGMTLTATAGCRLFWKTRPVG